MKTLILFFSLVISSQVVQATGSGKFYFNYISSDGQIYLDCSYSPLEIEPDYYRIVCGKGTNIIKTFDAKFRVRLLRVDTPVYELVLWVTDRNQPVRQDHSSSTWVTFNKGSLTDVAIHQDVENTYAALVVHYSSGL